MPTISRTFTARLDSRCAACEQLILAGDEAVYVKTNQHHSADDVLIHARCVDAVPNVVDLTVPADKPAADYGTRHQAASIDSLPLARTLAAVRWRNQAGRIDLDLVLGEDWGRRKARKHLDRGDEAVLFVARELDWERVEL